MKKVIKYIYTKLLITIIFKQKNNPKKVTFLDNLVNNVLIKLGWISYLDKYPKTFFSILLLMSEISAFTNFSPIIFSYNSI